MDDLQSPDAAVADAPVVADDSGSLSDHEAAFAPGAEHEEPAAAEETDAERDTNGQFKPRHRAKGQQAAAEDVPRIADLTKKWRTTEAERDTIRTRAEAAERERDELKARWAREQPAAEPAKPAAAKAPVIDPKDQKPTETDFDDYGDFIDARAAWSYRQIKREEAAAAADAKAKNDETAADRAFQRTVDAWVGRRDAFLSAHPERASAVTAFLETLRAGTPIADTILDSDVGADLADYLASHPDDAERIGKLSPVSAIRALGRIEAALEAPAAPRAPAPRAAVVPIAPRPPNPVRTGPSRSDTDVPGEDATLAEHERAYGPRRR